MLCSSQCWAGHKAVQATRLCRPLCCAGHKAVRATLLCRPLCRAGHKAVRATRPCRPQGCAGHDAVQATRLCRPQGCAGHKAVQATRPCGPQGRAGHKAVQATMLCSSQFYFGSPADRALHRQPRIADHPGLCKLALPHVLSSYLELLLLPTHNSQCHRTTEYLAQARLDYPVSSPSSIACQVPDRLSASRLSAPTTHMTAEMCQNRCVTAQMCHSTDVSQHRCVNTDVSQHRCVSTDVSAQMCQHRCVSRHIFADGAKQVLRQGGDGYVYRPQAPQVTHTPPCYVLHNVC